jgi:phage terminase large subunit GpA-like protein
MLKTVTIETGIGYFAHLDPGPMLVLQPGDTDAKDFSKERIAPMIRDTPVLHALFSEVKSRKTGSTITEKMFPGGMLAIAGAGSARNVARRAIRFFFGDEIDKYVPTSEGNPLTLARKRLATFRHRSKEILTCSPTVAGSQIDRAYEESDQRQYYVPCPYCGRFQSMMLKWRTQVKWSQDPNLTNEQRARTARYHCEFCCECNASMELLCDRGWTDAERWEAVEQGEWRAHAPFSGVAGFWISELYSPWKQLWEIAIDFLSKKDGENRQEFINTSLAENWEQKGEAPANELLYLRAQMEPYQRGNVPAGGLFLTCGVDVQKTFLQYEVVAWGRGKESWSIDYGVLDGNPLQPEVWKKLNALLNQTFPHEYGIEMPIVKMAIDTGYATNDVYSWVRSAGERAIAVKGRETGSVTVGIPTAVDVTVNGKKIANGVKLWPVGTHHAKSELYGWLMLKPPDQKALEAGEKYPAGFCHFPKQYEPEFFRQLTAEQLIMRFVKGFAKPTWEKKGPNHALDCRVYARGAAFVWGLDKAGDAHWDRLEEQMKPPAPPPESEPAERERPAQKPGGWLGGRGSNWFRR